MELSTPSSTRASVAARERVAATVVLRLSLVLFQVQARLAAPPGHEPTECCTHQIEIRPCPVRTESTFPSRLGWSLTVMHPCRSTTRLQKDWARTWRRERRPIPATCAGAREKNTHTPHTPHSGACPRSASLERRISWESARQQRRLRDSRE